MRSQPLGVSQGFKEMIDHQETNETLVARCHAGDRQALELLLERNEGAIRKIASRYVPGTSDRFNDAAQEGRLAFLDAVRSYDPARQTAFVTYLWTAVSRRLRRWKTGDRVIRVAYCAAQSGARPPRVWSDHALPDYHQAYSDPADDSPSVLDRLIDEEAGNVGTRAWLAGALDRLDGRLATLLRGRLAGKTLAEVGVEIGNERGPVSRERVRQLEARAVRELRAMAYEQRGTEK